ncbi:MAG TPA: preprotein translocase subunit SecG [Alphaproteobacteria bacterium]|nr:preprotein translocase subunit SecG [Alphaproteobacteria bacterium]
MLTILITVLHVVVCTILIVVVLLQHGKSADIAATFGGMGSQTAFGPRSTATIFSKITTWAAIIFMITSISLSILANRTNQGVGGSIMQNVKSTPAQQSAPSQTPAPAPSK